MRAQETHGRGVVPEPDGDGTLVPCSPAHARFYTVHGDILDVRCKLRTDKHVEADADQLLVRDQRELLVPVQDLGQLGGPGFGVFGAEGCKFIRK